MEECTLGKMDRKRGMQVSDGTSKMRFSCEAGDVQRSLEGYGPLGHKSWTQLKRLSTQVPTQAMEPSLLYS